MDVEQAGGSRAGRGMEAGRGTCKGPAGKKKLNKIWLLCCVVKNHNIQVKFRVQPTRTLKYGFFLAPSMVKN